MIGTQNLPAIVTKTGGALVEVIRDLDNYIDPQFELDRKAQFALGRVISDHPELNTEEIVGVLVDWFSYHGVSWGSKMREAITEYGVSVIGIVLEYLYQSGARTRGKGFVMPAHLKGEVISPRLEKEFGNSSRWSGNNGINEICELLVNVENAGYEVYNAERLDEAVQMLGGLTRACNMDASIVEGFINGEGVNDRDSFESYGDDDNV